MMGLARTVARHVQDPKFWRHVHAFMTVFWLLMVVPSLLWWKDSILYVILLSVWANLAAHFSAWQGSRAEDKDSSG